MRSRATLRAAGVSALALGLATAFPVTAGAAGKVAFTIKDDRVTEASGMARDTKNQVYWVVNDSGALGVVYGVDAKGKVKGTLRYNAFPQDAEAVAWNKDRLYVGDIGDNDEKRKSVRVYYFDDPKPNDKTRTYKAWDFRYPDGAHDAETLLVSPEGRLYIATKEVKGGLYRAPKKPSRDGVEQAQAGRRRPVHGHRRRGAARRERRSPTSRTRRSSWSTRRPATRRARPR